MWLPDQRRNLFEPFRHAGYGTGGKRQMESSDNIDPRPNEVARPQLSLKVFSPEFSRQYALQCSIVEPTVTRWGHEPRTLNCWVGFPLPKPEAKAVSYPTKASFQANYRTRIPR